ncbi:MAG TPA: uracil-DNA glycosylase [Candidatus Paenalcaligenes intestinipullorum]|uniref:Type-4 uracil-DNA glycosylase n=1 Tax=Candidatus Paenalcaligenes intestinipullorum TaxID=2838718 RepID=A0A9D2RG38_9BURK|nr:uracil-DNA glycosylase [Candidatus Paenalcaligenes intestinipullorum]
MGAPESALQLSAVQQAWLLELGLERALLQPYVPTRTKPSAAPALSAVSSKAEVNAPAAVHSSSRAAPAQDPSQATTANEHSGANALQAAINQLRQTEGTRRVATPSADKAESATSAAPSRPLQVATNLEDLQNQIVHCNSCALHEVRANAVVGRGSVQPRWFVIADSPSDADDRRGLAFDGPAGDLLQAMLSSVGLNADQDSYLTHLVKCRPMQNRAPTPEEVQRCSAYTLKLLELMQPNCILALGQITANQLLGTDQDIESLRGKVHHWTAPHGPTLPVVVTYHPAALLLRPQHKANAWRDLMLVKELDAQLR